MAQKLQEIEIISNQNISEFHYKLIESRSNNSNYRNYAVLGSHSRTHWNHETIENENELKF